MARSVSLSPLTHSALNTLPSASLTLTCSEAAAGYIVGAGCLGAGIPLWVKGNRGLRNIADDYNRTYINPDRNENSPNLSLGSTRSGIGLALNF